MRNIFTLFFFFCFVTTGFFLSAQNPFTFTNANSKFASAAFKSGNALSVVDMDGDGMDDIARLDGADNLYYTIQRTGQTFNNISAATMGSGNTWAMVVGDVDNNGIRDVAVGYSGSANLIKANASLTFSAALTPVVNLSGGNFFLQNMNFADINNDGWIDLFGCNDNGASRMWGNNGAGAYPATSNYFSTNNTGSTDNSGNYGSIWTDVNNDGHIDLYIAHCRQNNTPQDGNRLDQLFINDGNNNYVLDAAVVPGARGLRNNQQTWTSSFDDIDNDGDLDCLLTETDAPSKLFLNNGNGYFTEITNGSGFVLNVTPYQSKMEDLDNDGFVDIIISGDDARVFRNNHNNTFTLVNNLFNTNDMLSFATGDLNHDGKIDLYSSYGGVYNNPSTSINDVLWMNTTDNDNHFITFNLQGTQSNRDALGARVEIYGAWGKQVREVRAGESYGTTNSFMCHFGLGTATSLDSAIVRWPSGQVTRLYNKPADQFITVIEGQCSSPDNLITFNGSSVICGGQSVTMTAPAGYSYLWNTGDTTQAIATSVSGDFTVKVTDTGSGCSSISKMETVLSLPDQTPVVTASGPTRFCQGVSVDLQSSAATSYLWNTGETTQKITVTQTGNYFVTIQGSCAYFTSDTTPVAVDASEITNVVPSATCTGSLVPLTLQATATGDAYWYDAPANGNLVGTGVSYTTPVLTNTTTYYVESRDTIPGLEGNVGPANNAIGGGGPSNGYNFAQVFDVFKPLILKTVVVYANSAKSRTIELRNSANVLIQSATINIPVGTQTLTLNFSIPVGTGYKLGWAGTTPDLYRNNSGANYPYTIPNLISITGTTYTNQSYWYAYYNWQVEEQPIACASVRVPVVAAVNPLPSASITPIGATSFCDGGSVNLEADLNTSYLWSDNSTSQSLIATQSGSYSVTVTSADNCSSSSSITVTKFAAPDATVTTDKPTSICTGDNVTLSAVAGLTYTWSDNSNLQSVTVSSDGTFSVTVTDNHSCTAESTPIQVTVSNNAVAGITASGVTTFCEGGSVQLTASSGTAYLWSDNSTSPEITVNASGTFTVTVTGSGSCVAISNPIQVVVNTNPVAIITHGGSTTFCEGGTVDLSVSSADSYLWSSGSTLSSISVTESGSYSAAITDVNGCSAASSATVVTVNPNPVVSFSGLNAQYFNTDAAVTLTGSPSGGTFSGSGMSGSTFDPAVAGVGGPYTITYNYTDGNGCSASVSSDITVELGSAVHQIEGVSMVNVYPNPNEGEFLLTLKSDGAKKIDIAITNYLGEKVFEEKNVTAANMISKQISLKNVAKGFYNLTITSGKKQNTYKLIVQ